MYVSVLNIILTFNHTESVVQAQVGVFRVKLGGGSGSSVAQPNAPLILFISWSGALGQHTAFKCRNSV